MSTLLIEEKPPEAATAALAAPSGHTAPLGAAALRFGNPKGLLSSCVLPAKGAGPRSLFAMDADGVLLHIDDVPTSTKGLVCPDCNTRLIAKHSSRGRADHFAHHEAEECKTAGETALHLLGKDVFLSIQEFPLPPFTIEADYEARRWNGVIDETWTSKGWVPNYDLDEADILRSKFTIAKVRLEVYQDGIKPDLIITDDKGRELYVEILVTHRVDDDKKAVLTKRKQPTIEINLSKMERTAPLDDIKKAVEAGLYGSWIYSPKIEAQKQKRITQETAKREEEARAEARRREKTKMWAEKCVGYFQKPDNNTVFVPNQQRHERVIKETLRRLGLNMEQHNEKLFRCRPSATEDSPFRVSEEIVFYELCDLLVVRNLEKLRTIFKRDKTNPDRMHMRYLQGATKISMQEVSDAMEAKGLVKRSLNFCYDAQKAKSLSICPGFYTASDAYEAWIQTLKVYNILVVVEFASAGNRLTIGHSKIKQLAAKMGAPL